MVITVLFWQFYVNTIKGSFCTDSVDALFNASALMVSVPTLMMLFFCFAAIYIPVLKDVKYRKKNQKALGDAFDVENNAVCVVMTMLNCLIFCFFVCFERV